MANYIQIRAKKASDVIGAGVISYALIGSILLYKFHINLMEYTTPIDIVAKSVSEVAG